MEDKSKLFVFDKKELALIFIFMILISVISFTIGFRIGKKISYESGGITPQDLRLIELKSTQEEEATKIFNKMGTGSSKQAGAALETAATKKLKKEFDDLRGEENPVKAVQPAEEKKTELVKQLPQKAVAIADKPVVKQDSDIVVKKGKERDVYLGKYTIQLGSHQKLNEAKEFADGFTIRGYNPIINEVNIEGRGIWYRVSLGTFETVAEAKEYIKKEESLFQGSNYVITELQ